jgi:CheY-like chemotaxis protein
VLESAGYTVLEAEDGHKALMCFREHHDRIHLALLDVVMPGMGGREAYKEMLKINPELKALFASGYSENAIHTNFVLDSGLALLKKPYSRDDLLRAVRRQLDQ